MFGTQFGKKDRPNRIRVIVINQLNEIIDRIKEVPTEMFWVVLITLGLSVWKSSTKNSIKRIYRNKSDEDGSPK